MKMTIKHTTFHTLSPVIEYTAKSGFILKAAVNSDGEIYRLVKYRETLKECTPFEIEISEKTEKLLSNWEQFHQSTSSNNILHCLDTIQQYYVLLGYSSIRQHPLYALDIKEYYPCSSALEQFNQKIERQKIVDELRKENSSLKQQLTILQAKLKVPGKMAEKNCNEKQALAYILGGKNYETYFDELFENKIIHPNSYTGKGKYCSKGNDKAAAIANMLTLAGIKHTTGNDAPKGGFSGNFIKIK